VIAWIDAATVNNTFRDRAKETVLSVSQQIASRGPRPRGRAALVQYVATGARPIWRRFFGGIREW